MKIPLNKFNEDTQIILDLEINENKLRIIRTKEKPENPIIIINKNETEYLNLDDATKELKRLFFSDFENIEISFKEFLGPFFRDEDSEFKEILKCYNLKKNIPASINPHAFIFNLEVSTINKIKKLFKEIDNVNMHKIKLKKSLTENNTKKISDVKVKLNSLNDDLKKIESVLESFKSNEAYELQQDDLAKSQIEIDKIRIHQSALKYELKRIETFPSLEIIKKKEIEIIYNQFKDGLGDIITKSINEVIDFKNKIDEFQKNIFQEKINSLNSELEHITKKLRNLEDIKANKLKIIDTKGVLKDIKNGYAIYHQKKDSFSNIQSRYNDYEIANKEWKDLKLKKDINFQLLDTKIFEAKVVIDNFNKTILNIHEYIMDSNEASFDINTINK